MLAYALNAIHLKKGDAVVVQQPKEVFECASETQFNELLGLGAIRQPTDAERALYGLANPTSAPAPKLAPKPKETAAEKKAREAAEKEAERVAAEAAAAEQTANDEAARLAAGGDPETL